MRIINDGDFEKSESSAILLQDKTRSPSSLYDENESKKFSRIHSSKKNELKNGDLYSGVIFRKIVLWQSWRVFFVFLKIDEGMLVLKPIMKISKRLLGNANLSRGGKTI